MTAWQLHSPHPWQSPLALAAEHETTDMALLYSSRTEETIASGQRSFLLLHPLEHAIGATWDALPEAAEDTGHDAQGAPLPDWVGYLGYGLRGTDDPTPRRAPAPIDLPNLHFTRYGRLFLFDHARELVTEYRRGSEGPIPRSRGVEGANIVPSGGCSSASPHPLDAAPCASPIPRQRWMHPSPTLIPTNHESLTSNLTRAEYENLIHATLEEIRAGHFYQANITRKFYGSLHPDKSRLTTHDSPLPTFTTLCATSPAPYSAYLRHGDRALLSSSPECFLTAEADGTLITRPIKGSAQRGASAAEDEALAEALRNSAKNRAENLMIVDLMRNDLARVCKAGSVTVAEHAALRRYATIHHLVSTITGRRRADISVREVLRACFPAGSMTGAPKRAAMAWCTAQEPHERGVYSGALGWLGAGGTFDFSVVIRTLILQGNCFEFQVGGGIVADSTPEEEWHETLVKARGIARALGITESDLAGL